MKIYEFVGVNGLTYKRVNRAVAKKSYDAGESIVMCGCNLRPGKPWYPESYYNMGNHECVPFESAENAFLYYNAPSRETGRYPAFYVAK